MLEPSCIAQTVQSNHVAAAAAAAAPGFPPPNPWSAVKKKKAPVIYPSNNPLDTDYFCVFNKSNNPVQGCTSCNATPYSSMTSSTVNAAAREGQESQVSSYLCAFFGG